MQSFELPYVGNSDIRQAAPLGEEHTGIALLDADCHYLHVSPILAAFHGHKQGDYLQRHISEMIPGNILSVVAPLYKHVVSTHLPIHGIDFYAAISNSNPVRHWRASYFPTQAGGVRASISCFGEVPVPFGIPFHLLSRAECSVLELLAKGKRTKEIAESLHLSVLTVATHRKRICKKLGIHSTSELAAAANSYTWNASMPELNLSGEQKYPREGTSGSAESSVD